MPYEELLSYLPDRFQMLLVASRQFWGESTADNLVCVSMPLKLHDLLDTVSMMSEAQERRRRKLRARPRERAGRIRRSSGRPRRC